MKKSIDLMNQKNFNQIIPQKEIENEEDEREDKLDINLTSLNRLRTLNNELNNREISKIYNTSNSSIPKNKKKILSDEIEEKLENNEKNERIRTAKHIKNKSINKMKSQKGVFEKINLNKKIVYIKKINNDVKDRKDNTINQTIDKDVSQENEPEVKEKEIIKEIKESVICYICLMKIEKPRICPNCHKIACEKCLKIWFIDKGNNNCGYCRAALSFDKMISVPIINNVANLIDKIFTKNKGKKIGALYTKIKKKNNTDIPNDIINEDICEINNDDIIRNTINIDNIKRLANKKEQLYLNKKKNIMSHSTHHPYVNMIQNKDELVKDEEYCTKHPEQPLFYYCINCKQAYCRTCFVFFGEEKDKHNMHSIIEYDKYKSMNIPDAIKNCNNLDDKYEEIDAYIKRCEALKNCYEFERSLVENQIKNLLDNYNSKVDENIKKLDNIINKYKYYLAQIKKCKNDIEQFYMTQKYNQDLIEKVNNLNKIKYYNSKEIDNFSDLSNYMELTVYQTKLKKYEIKQNNYHFKISLDNSKYQLAITRKANEVQIYIYWPEDKEFSEESENNKKYLPIIFMRKKNKNWECFQLNEFLKYKGNYYFIKRFSANNFCNPNSYLKIKGILYLNYIE